MHSAVRPRALYSDVEAPAVHGTAVGNSLAYKTKRSLKIRPKKNLLPITYFGYQVFEMHKTEIILFGSRSVGKGIKFPFFTSDKLSRKRGGAGTNPSPPRTYLWRAWRAGTITCTAPPPPHTHALSGAGRYHTCCYTHGGPVLPNVPPLPSHAVRMVGRYNICGTRKRSTPAIQARKRWVY